MTRDKWTRILNLQQLLGGPGRYADWRRVEIVRASGTEEIVNMQEALKANSQTNPTILPGDEIKSYAVALGLPNWLGVGRP